MDWIQVAAFVFVALGLVGGGYVVAQRPKFWIELVSRLSVALAPIIWAFVSKRMTPEEEAKWRHEQLSGVKPPTTGVTTGTTITQPAATKKDRSKP